MGWLLAIDALVTFDSWGFALFITLPSIKSLEWHIGMIYDIGVNDFSYASRDFPGCLQHLTLFETFLPVEGDAEQGWRLQNGWGSAEPGAFPLGLATSGWHFQTGAMRCQSANPRYAGEFAGGLCKETGSNPDGSIQQYHGDVGQDFAMIRSKDGRFHHEICIDTIKDTVKFGGNCNQHEGGLIWFIYPGCVSPSNLTRW